MTNLDSLLKSRDITLSIKVHLVKAMGFPVVIFGCESWTIKKAECRRIDALICGVREDSWEFLGLQRDPTSPSKRKSILNIHWKDRCWSWNSNMLATWWEELTHWKRPWCWERLKAGEKGDDRGWDCWMASPKSPIWWTWVRVGSGSWWWTRKPGALESVGSQRVRHNWATELNWTKSTFPLGIPIYSLDVGTVPSQTLLYTTRCFIFPVINPELIFPSLNWRNIIFSSLWPSHWACRKNQKLAHQSTKSKEIEWSSHHISYSLK